MGKMCEPETKFTAVRKQGEHLHHLDHILGDKHTGPSKISEMSQIGSLLPLKQEDLPLVTGNVIYITGGGSGIGLACARLFAQREAKGVVIADYKLPAPELLRSLPSNVAFVQTDVTSWSSMVASFDSCIERFGRLDYVFANAGVGEMEHLFEDHFEHGRLKAMEYTAIDVKYDQKVVLVPDSSVADIISPGSLKGVLNTVKLAVHWFRKLNVPGRIVMTTSMSGYETPGIPIYVSSKHGVVGILRSASLDLYEHFGICLNSVAPGPVLTNLVDSFAPRRSSQTSEGYLFENQDPVQPAIAAAYLLSQDIHGKAILVFGGRFREIEEVYSSIREQMLGGPLGMPPVSDKGWRNLFSCSF